jgi:hypothetical protein
MERKILSVTVVVSQGAKVYAVGDTMPNGKVIERINQADLHFTGDPYDHYCGLASDGEMLFSINCLVPCVVEYA